MVTEELSSTVYIVLFLILLAINLVFWFYWLKLTFVTLYLKMQTCLPCLKKKNLKKQETDFDGVSVVNLDEDEKSEREESS